MSNAPQLYALYQQLLEQSQLMLRLARQGLWDDLIICETDYVNAVHSLARLTQESEPSTQIQEQLRPTLRVIPTTKAVKRCCKPEWMNWRSWLVNPPSRKPFSPPTVTGGHVRFRKVIAISISHLTGGQTLTVSFAGHFCQTCSILEFRDLMEMVHAQPNTFTMFSLVLPTGGELWREVTALAPT